MVQQRLVGVGTESSPGGQQLPVHPRGQRRLVGLRKQYSEGLPAERAGGEHTRHDRTRGEQVRYWAEVGGELYRYPLNERYSAISWFIRLVRSEGGGFE